eukprot:4786344-Prymnesium_polylepis.1
MPWAPPMCVLCVCSAVCGAGRAHSRDGDVPCPRKNLCPCRSLVTYGSCRLAKPTPPQPPPSLRSLPRSYFPTGIGEIGRAWYSRTVRAQK